MADYIIELKQFGKVIKINAIDPATLKEISIAVPSGKKLSRDDMCKMAIKRLEYVLQKKDY